MTYPRHVALIPDGIRRWAAKESTSHDVAYERAMTRLEPITDSIFQSGATVLSIYILSRDNLSRDKLSLGAVFRGEIAFFQDILPRIANKWNARIVHAGDPAVLPHDYLNALRVLCDSTTNHSQRQIYLCAGYHPEDEILHAVSTAQRNSRSLFESLWVPERVDLLIRTGAEHRTSNMLPLQVGYAELFFVDKFFPDVQESDIHLALDDYSRRQRRYGA